MRVIATLAAAALVASIASVATAATPSRGTTPRTVPAPLGSWSALGSGLDDTVWTLAFTQDGRLLAGGNFTQAGGTPALSVATWNGTSWSQVGAGLTDLVSGGGRVVSDVQVVGNKIYAAGNFSRSGAGIADDTGLAVFDGASWAGVGGGVQPRAGSQILGVFVHDDSVYVAGEFDQAGPPPADDSGIALWNGSAWSNLAGGFPGTPGVPRALDMLSNGHLVVGGQFLQAGPGAADDTNIAVWNGTTWSSLAGGLGNAATQVYSLAVARDDSIYAGGNFASADNGLVTAKGIAKWDGSHWHAVGSGVGINSGAVRAIVLDEDRQLIYLGGGFTSMDGVVVNRVTVRDEVTDEWVPFVDAGVVGVSGGIEAVAVRGPNVYVGGLFASAGPVGSVGRIARWTWSPPTGNNVLTSSPGQSITVSGAGFIGVPVTGGVYIGGVPSPSYVRDDSTSFSNVVIPSAVYGTVPIEVDAVGGRASVGSVTLPGPPTPTPASPPRAVSAAAADRSAVVSWSAPESSGTFPVTTYHVIASPGGASCLVSAPALSCAVDGLANGSTYTFTVTALTGAGWSAASEPSNAVTPSAPPRPSVIITGTRDGQRIEVSGTTTGFGMGGTLRPWVKLAGETSYTQGVAEILVSMDGTFKWGRKTSKKAYVYVATPDGSVRSNKVTIAAK